MDAKIRRKRLTLPIAPIFGALCGVGTAAAIMLLPIDGLEDFIIESGLPSILPAAEPPLGMTARLGVTMIGAGGVGLVTWFLLFLFIGSRTIGFGSEAGHNDDPFVPVLRRADAHPDAPARRPLFASEDLGAPFLSVRAFQPEPEPDKASFALPTPAALDVFAPLPLTPAPPVSRPLPVDLDVPLSAYDPQAMMPAPAPLPRPNFADPADRLPPLDPAPVVHLRTGAEPVPQASENAAPDIDASIAALLDRLERSVAQRMPYTPIKAPAMAANEVRSLNDTLGALRRMATRAG